MRPMPLAAANSIRPMHYLVIPAKTMASNASAEATPRKSGTRYIRSFATPLSTSAIAKPTIATFGNESQQSHGDR